MDSNNNMNDQANNYSQYADYADYLTSLAFTDPQQFVGEVMGVVQYRLMYEAMKTMQTALLNQLMVIDQTIGNINIPKDKPKGEDHNEL